MKAILALEDGTIFEGEAFGATGESGGEVIFNTSMTGYQEILTDPSYYGQIIMLTYPLIGNYGITKEDFESHHSHARGLIVKEISRQSSNWRAMEELEQHLIDNNIIGIEGIDTRALTRRLRNSGTMKGVITTIPDRDSNQLVQKAKRLPDLSGQDLCRLVGTNYSVHMPGPDYRVVMLDFGHRKSTVHTLNSKGCDVTILPFWTGIDEILSYEPQGIFLSDGPGDPRDVDYVLSTIKSLIDLSIEKKIPLYSNGLGHQLIALALGGKIEKLKYGHRGANLPIKDLMTGKIHIVAQNHGYAVDEASIAGTGLKVAQRSLTDHCIEAIMHEEAPIYTLQYNPGVLPAVEELIPLLPDAAPFFDAFVEAIKQNN